MNALELRRQEDLSHLSWPSNDQGAPSAVARTVQRRIEAITGTVLMELGIRLALARR